MIINKKVALLFGNATFLLIRDDKKSFTCYNNILGEDFL